MLRVASGQEGRGGGKPLGTAVSGGGSFLRAPHGTLPRNSGPHCRVRRGPAAAQLILMASPAHGAEWLRGQVVPCLAGQPDLQLWG